MRDFDAYARILPRLRRKVFVSYFRGDKTDVETFVNTWGYLREVFIPHMVEACGNEVINSQNAECVIGRIRREQIADSTVTMLLLGSCTRSRRHVDWEIKASLRQGEDRKPNGLLGIVLPCQGNWPLLPERSRKIGIAQGTAMRGITALPPPRMIWHGGSKMPTLPEKTGRS